MENEKWYELQGDDTLALNWPLNEDSYVWEIGGYEGRWVAQMYEKFHCKITTFEPQMWAVERMRTRFNEYNKIDIRPYGLWMEHGEFMLGNFFTDGASLTTESPRSGDKGLFVDYKQELEYSDPVDVCLMNIEGAEYTLLPDMIKTGLISHFNYFWCQFHLKDDPDGTRSRSIFEGMKATHEILWDCFPTAVAWRKK